MQLAKFDGPSSKIPYKRKNLAKTSYASRVIANFVPNFFCHGNGGRSGKTHLAAFDGPFPKNPLLAQKKLKKFFYVSQVIAHFVPNFVAMVEKKCNWQHSMAHHRNPLWAQKSRKNFLRKPCYSLFCPKLRCHGNQGESGIKLNDTNKFAIFENHTLDPKNTTLSYTQPKL